MMMNSTQNQEKKSETLPDSNLNDLRASLVEARIMANRMEKEEKQKMAKTDLKYLFEEVLGYDKLDDFHLEIIEELKNVEKSSSKKGLFLLPRGHWKSTLITIAYTIQRILINPDISVFISNATFNNSVAFLR